MEKVGCTTPFGFNSDNVCIEKENREEAFKIYNSQKNKRNKIENCQYPCNFIRSWLSVEQLRLNQTSKDFSLNFDKHFDPIASKTPAHTKVAKIEIPESTLLMMCAFETKPLRMGVDFKVVTLG